MEQTNALTLYYVRVSYQSEQLSCRYV